MLFRSQIDNILQDFEYRLKMQGLSFENYLQYSNETIDSIREKYQTDAQKSVKEQLVLEAVAKKENLVVEETDLEEEFARLSALYKQEPEKVKELLEKQGQMEAVKHSIIIDKAIQLIIDNANIS